jgi:branched-chain amino acid transport system substrate-binding protein
VEQDGVLLLFGSIGTESNLAIRQYLNNKNVPQLFLQSSSAVFDDPAHFPWTMGFFATYRTEGRVYAQYILENKPRAKIAVLYADDDAGKEYLVGVHEGLGDKAGTAIVKEVPYRESDASLEPQITALKNSGADVFLNLSVGTFATRAIRQAYDSDWHPMQFIPNASLSQLLRFWSQRVWRRRRESFPMRDRRGGCVRKRGMIPRCASFWNG